MCASRTPTLLAGFFLLTLSLLGCGNLKSPVLGLAPEPIVQDTTWTTARALYDAKNYPAAIPFLLSISDTSSHFAAAGYYCGRSYYEIAAADSTKSALYDSALALFLRPAVLGDTLWFDNAYYYAGRSSYALLRFDAAIAFFHALPTSSSYYVDAQLYIGYSFQALGIVDSAGVYLGADKVNYAAAKDLYDAKNYAAAISRFLLISDTSHYAVDAAYYCGRSYYEIAAADTLQSALYANAAALLTRPGVMADTGWFDNARYYAGRSYYSLAQYGPAAPLLREVPPSSTYYTEACYYAGRSWYAEADSLHMDRYDSAVAAFALVRAPSSLADNAAYYGARACYAQGNWQGALDRFAAAGSYSFDIAYYRGRCFYNSAAADTTKAALYDSAAVVLSAFRSANPASGLVDNAAYYAGRARYEQGFWRAALDLFVFAGNSSASVDYYRGSSWYELTDSLHLEFYDSARVHYDLFVAAAAQSSLADNAAYYAGLCFYNSDDYVQAEARFSSFGSSWPSSTLRDNALNWLMHTRIKQSDCSGAASALQELQGLLGADAVLVADAEAYYTDHCP